MMRSHGWLMSCLICVHAIIRDLGLRRPIYQTVAAYGHFGREDLDLPWERLDRLEELKAAAGVGSSAAAGN